MKAKIKNFLFKKRIKILKNKKGFSLVELLVTVGIMGTLVGVGVPAYNTYQANSTEQAVRSEASNLMKAFQACLIAEADPATCVTADVNGTVSVTCKAGKASKPSGAADDGCYFERETGSGTPPSSDVICFGSFRANSGGKHACVQFDLRTNKISSKIATGKYCKDDGACT